MTDIDNLRALYEKATQVGEWFAGHAPGPVTQEEYGPARLSAIREFSSGTRSRVYLPWQDADADLIVALHNAFPALASELEAARKEATKLREALEELVEAHDYWFSTGMGEARAIAATVKAKGVLG